MAEVKLSMIKKHTVSYIDNGALITAKIAPPSLTYLDPQSRVTISKDPVIIVTYTDSTDVELESTLHRDVENTIELEGRIERVVDSNDPFKYTITGNLERSISNSVELEYQLQRTVLSFNVDLTCGIRRIVTRDIEIEGNLSREVRAKIDLEGNLCRVIQSDEDEQSGIPEKEYLSFIDKNKLFRVQHDVLDEDISDNPYFAKEISNLQNAALLTKNQTIIKAINELVVNQKELFVTIYNNIEKMNNEIGSTVEDADLRTRYNKLEFANIKEAIISLSDNIDIIIKFIGSQSEELDSYKELEYKNLIDGLVKLNNQLKELSYQWDDLDINEVEWIFKDRDYIADIRDTVIDMLNEMNDEIKSFEQKVSDKFIAFAQDNEDQMVKYYQSFLDVFNDCEDITEERIRKIFYYLLDNETMEESEDPVVQLVVSLSNDLAEYKMTVTKALTAISDEFYNASDLTEQDVKEIFNYADGDPDEVSFETTVIEFLNKLDSSLLELAETHQHDTTKINEDLITLDEKLSTLNKTHIKDVNDIHTSITEVSNDLSTLSNRVDTEVSTINTRFQTDESNLEQLQQLHAKDVEEFNSLISEVSNNLSELNETHRTDINSIRSILNEQEASINTLREEHQADISSLKTEIEEDIKVALDDLQTSYDQDMAAIRLDISNVSTDVEDLLSLHNKDMEDLRAEITHQGQVIEEDILKILNEVKSDLVVFKDNTNQKLDDLESRTGNLETLTEDHTKSIEDLDYRVSNLEIAAMFPELPFDRPEILTVEDIKDADIVSEAEIESLFNEDTTLDDTRIAYIDTVEPDTSDSDNAIVSEEDIKSLFN